MKPRRRLFQFSLRSLLVLLTIGCLWLGWKTERVREQRETVQAIEALGGFVRYDWECYPASSEAPPGPVWLRRMIGDEFFQEPVSVWFDQITGSDEKIAEEILLNGPNPRRSRMRILLDAYAARTQKAFPFLARLPRLRSVWVEYSVSDEVQTKLSAALPTCEVAFSNAIPNVD